MDVGALALSGAASPSGVGSPKAGVYVNNEKCVIYKCCTQGPEIQLETQLTVAYAPPPPPSKSRFVEGMGWM